MVIEDSKIKDNRKNIKKITFWTIIFIQIIQCYFIVRSFFVYEGLHMVSSLLFPCFYIGFVCYKSIFGRENIKYKHFRMTLLIVIAITAVPLIIYITKPEITYEEGKKLIVEKNGTYGSYEFEPYKRGQNTIPVCNNPERYMVRNRTYYYRISDGIEYVYFVVNPIDKEVHRMEEDYWAEDK